MFKNHLKIAWRTLLKDKQFTFLNVLGLSIGIACTLLIYLWVNDEMSFDKFFEKESQLYQLMERRNNNEMSGVSDESSGLLGEALKLRMPEIEYATAVAPPEWWQKFTLSFDDNNIKATGQYAGPDYFNVFSFKLIDGKKDDVLKDKSSIVISDELAKKLFGTAENVVGKSIRFQQEKNFFVSGVFERLPYHSSTQFDFVLSFEYLAEVQGWVKSWYNTGPHNYVLLRKGTDIASFNKRIAGIIKENTGDTTRIAYAAKFSDNYLANTFDHGSKVGSKVEYVKLFSLIAIFILGIACINFMNLSTAKASRRMKEVGIKKVVGAGRSQLILQFLSESIMLTIFATILAVCIAWFLLPQFNLLTGKQISFNFDTGLVIALICITIFTGLLSGSYPALYLSKFNPLSVLKGKLNSSFAEIISRKGLVVFQFTLSVILIVSMIVIYQQVQYIQKTNPGYSKDNVLRFNIEGKILGNEEAFMAELKKIPGVANTCYTFNNMVGRIYGQYGLEWEGKGPSTSIYFEGFGVSYDFIETMGMQMASGRNFSKEFGDENNKIILNEAAVKLMQLKDPVGKTIKLNDQPNQIIGIVKDFHFESLHEPVKQSYIKLSGGNNPWNKMMVRIKAGHEQETIAQIEKLHRSYSPGFPFDFNFLDEAYQKQYLSETRVGILSRYFAGLAIFISCLGLFGLAAFTAQKRQKEIGIRKVIGASLNNITVMLSKNFLGLVIIAVLIAFPLAWWAMNSWLQGFAFRISMNPAVFLIAGSSVVLITILTVSFQAIKAALANPVKSLRTE
ncbi:MAG TPA: ABC transporter permease [Chitinophagaceae bacterium]|nr:ABC transporter permease [Chitinophagaceae bacterium]